MPFFSWDPFRMGVCQQREVASSCGSSWYRATTFIHTSPTWYKAAARLFCLLFGVLYCNWYLHSYVRFQYSMDGWFPSKRRQAWSPEISIAISTAEMDQLLLGNGGVLCSSLVNKHPRGIRIYGMRYSRSLTVHHLVSSQIIVLAVPKKWFRSP